MGSNDINVKICGLKDSNAAIVAANAGADYLGFNFVKESKRRVSPEECARLIAEYNSGKEPKNSPALVGLFRDQDHGFVNEVATEVGFAYLQLCGNEDLTYISNVNLPIFKQVFVKPGMSAVEVREMVAPFLNESHGIVLDSFTKGALGGSGKTFDWESAIGVASLDRVLLAGGLNPENVGTAIEQLSPWGVDVASGVETDGVKDPDRIEAFIRTVRRA